MLSNIFSINLLWVMVFQHTDTALTAQLINRNGAERGCSNVVQLELEHWHVCFDDINFKRLLRPVGIVANFINCVFCKSRHNAHVH